MKQTYYQFLATIIAITFFIQSSQEIYSQEALSADTPFIEVNGKIIKFGSAIIAFSKLRQRNVNFDENTIFSQIVQQLVNEELLSQKIDKENKLTLFALEHEKRSAKAAQMVSKILKNWETEYKDISLVNKRCLNNKEFTGVKTLLFLENNVEKYTKYLFKNSDLKVLVPIKELT